MWLAKREKSVCSSVISAAHYLTKYSWVDKSKMGVNGHSFGGYETNYLATYPKLFSAAVTASGPSNLLSYYGEVYGNLPLLLQELPFRMFSGNGPDSDWLEPLEEFALYLNNSPILSIGTVTTPILIMHNISDPLVPWTQSLQFYLGLRRLQKQSWLLQYDDGSAWPWYHSKWSN